MLLVTALTTLVRVLLILVTHEARLSVCETIVSSANAAVRSLRTGGWLHGEGCGGHPKAVVGTL